MLAKTMIITINVHKITIIVKSGKTSSQLIVDPEKIKLQFVLFNRDLNRGCLVYMFSLRFSGSKFLTNLRRQFGVRKIFRTQGFAGFTVFSFCV